MAGLEVEDLAVAAMIAAAAAEDLATGIPADEDQFVGSGNVEVLTVGLFLLQNDLFI